MRLRRYEPFDNVFQSSLIELLPCDLRYSQAVDVNGDGYQDLIRRAHPADDECPQRVQSKWLPNLGKEPWFDRGGTNDDWQDLVLPLEDPAAAGVTVEPPDLNPDWTPQFFVAEQARYGDFNLDGLVDVAYAFHARWEKHLGGAPCPDPPPRINEEPCQWRPVLGSHFSRIYWGDGYGGFIHSGLSAGTPILNHKYEWPDRFPEEWYTSYFSVLDLDRSGTLEMVTSRLSADYVPYLGIFPYRGVAYGFGLNPVESDFATDQGNLIAQGVIPTDGYPHASSDCHDEMTLPVFADFDGDGFNDLLTIKYNPEGFPGAPCFGTDWCATLEYATRDIAQGRVTASDGSWGGRTKLEWSFSAELLLNGNRELPTNLETLSAVEGSEGRIELDYAKGAQGDSFGGFGLVQKRNARGGLDVFAHATPPALAGKPIYYARYRDSQTLDEVTVFVHGQLEEDGRYTLDVAPPYFNPLIRQCDYKVERKRNGQSASLEELVRHCWGWQGRKIPSNEQLWAAFGSFRYPASGPEREVADAVWGSGGPSIFGPQRVTLTGAAGTSVGIGWDFVPSAGYLPIGWRWKPSGVDLPAALDAEEVLGSLPNEATGAGYTAEVTDWIYGQSNLLQPTRILRHRDIATRDDDLATDLTWDTTHPSRDPRMASSVTSDRGGAVLFSLTRSTFSGFDDAGEARVCGRGGASCFRILSSWHGNGSLQSRERPDLGLTETWDHGAWCGDETYRDLGGRVRNSQFDERCRAVSESWRGVETSYGYDGFNRPVSVTVDPNGSGDTTVTKHRYDDEFEHREDRAYEEPRTTSQIGSRLEMEYLDGFGRRTKLVSCTAAPLIDIDPTTPGPTKPGTGTIPGKNPPRIEIKPSWHCLPGTELVHQWNLYGTDGMLRAFALPFKETSETPAFSLVEFRDGAGRETVIRSPAHVDLQKSAPRWETEYLWYAPGRRVRKNPLGQFSVDKAGTLQSESRINGRLVNRIKWDLLGEPKQTEDPENGVLNYRYDARHRLAAIERAQPAPVVDEAGALTDQTYRRRFEYDGLDRLVGVIEADGTALRTTLDPLGRPLRQIFATAAGKTARLSTWDYAEDAEGVVSRTERDELGSVTIATFDGLDRPLSWTTPDGTTLNWAWRTGLRHLEVTRNDGQRTLKTVYSYDIQDRLIGMTAPDGAWTELELNGAGYPKSITDPYGVKRTRSYLFSGRLGAERLQAAAGSWLLREASYDASGRLSKLTSGGVEKGYLYDQLGRLSRIDVGGKVPLLSYAYRYDGNSRRKKSIEATSAGYPAHLMRFDYDAWGRQTRRINSGPGERKYLYDLAGRLRLEVDEEGYRREIRYDPRGRVIYYTTPGQGEMTLRYDLAPSYDYRHRPDRSAANLWVTIGRDGVGGETRAWSDGMGRLVAMLRPDQSLEERVYDGGELTEIYQIGDATRGIAETRSQLLYDTFGRLVGTYGPAAPEDFGTDSFDPAAFDGYRVVRSLGLGGRLQSIDAGGEVTAFDYDAVSGLLTAENFRGLSRRFDYRTPKGDSHDYPWSQGERLLGQHGETRTQLFTRDLAGRVISEQIDAGDRRVLNQWKDFSPFGLPAVEIRQSGPAARPLSEEASYRWTFDDNGRPLSRALTLEGVPQGETVWSWYDNGRLKSEQGPSGSGIAYFYGTPFDHKLDRIASTDGSETYARVTARDGRNLATAIELAEGTLSLTWDSAGRLTGRSFDAVASGIADTNWSGEYDGLGRLVRKETSDGRQSNWTSYTYDKVGRLVEETRNVGSETEQLAYGVNSAGSRTKTWLNGATVGALGYDPNHPVERVVYVDGSFLLLDPWDAVVKDQHGNSYNYDADGELREIASGSISYSILRDADGLPVAVRPQDGNLRITSWRLDPSDRPLEVLESSGNRRRYVGIEGLVLQTLVTATDGTAISASSALDAVGSAIPFRDAGYAPTTAFGDGMAESEEEWFRFGGMETFPGIPGVHLARHRVYDAASGRFLRPDPVGLYGGLHRSLYANGDPVGFADPLGLWACAAEPGSLPHLSSGLPKGGTTPPGFGYSESGNSQYDMMILQLAHGLDPAATPDWSNLSIGLDNPHLPQPCGFMCGPPGDGESGLPSDGVSTLPMAPAPTAAIGGGSSSNADKAEQRRIREQSKLERKLARFELKEKLTEIKAEEKYGTYTSKLADLEDKDISELYALAGEIIGCRNGVCSDRKMQAVHGMVGLLLGDPPDDLPADPPPQAQITKVLYEAPDLELDFALEPGFVIVSGRDLPTARISITKVINVTKIIRPQPPTPAPEPPVNRTPGTGEPPDYANLLEGLNRPEEKDDHGLSGSVTARSKGCSVGTSSSGCELEISLPTPIPGMSPSVKVGVEVEGDVSRVKSLEDAKRLNPSIRVGGKVETPIGEIEAEAKATEFSPCRDCNKGQDELELEWEREAILEEQREMMEQAILEAEEKCLTTGVCETPFILPPDFLQPKKE